jgi:protein phosphatase
MAVDILSWSFVEAWPASASRLAQPDRAVLALNILDGWVRDANNANWVKAREDERFAGMGTTLLVLVEVGNQLVRCHVGDSRIYRFRGGVLTQVTRDHSLVQAQLDQGTLTAAEAAKSAQKNVITRALGSYRDVKPELGVETPEEGDVYVLRSDGLTDMVSDAEIARILLAGGAPDVRARALVDAANEAGGRDNITVVVADWRS